MELENNQKCRKQKKSPAITPEQRQEFYRLRYTECQRINTIAEKFGVNRRTVRENIAKFADEIKTAYERKVDMSKLADAERIKALEKENKKLRAELSKSELHVKFLETMVDIAERNFNIPIKKKAGTRPSEP